LFRTLRLVVCSEEPLPLGSRIDILHKVAAGLAYLHALPSPIVHADLKASNILIGAAQPEGALDSRDLLSVFVAYLASVQI
jgi:serine/threonine protein kinase